MKMTYYEDSDTLSIELVSAASASTESLSENLTVDRDQEGRIVAIDLEHAGRYLDRQIMDATGRFVVEGQRVPGAL